MEMNEPPLKLGRITRKVEEVLELAMYPFTWMPMRSIAWPRIAPMII